MAWCPGALVPWCPGPLVLVQWHNGIGRIHGPDGTLYWYLYLASVLLFFSLPASTVCSGETNM